VVNTNVRDKFVKVEKEMCDVVKERDEVIHGLLIALLSRSHVFLVGPPGTAKSMLIRLLAGCIDGAKYFEWLMTKTTTDAEIFGPPKFSALKADRYERNTNGKLPEAHFVFLDEIWKSSSSIANTLLTAINERMFHNNGSPTKIPLETLLAASNELPEKDTLAAMWDRFLLRYVVDYVQEDGHIREVFIGDMAPKMTTLKLSEIRDAQKQVDDIKLQDAVLDALIVVRKELKVAGIQPSDRRYRASISALKANAWMDGRSIVTMDDLEILTACLWDAQDHIPIVRKTIMMKTNPYQRQADELFDAILSAKTVVENCKDQKDKTMAAAETTGKINNAVKQLEQLRSTLKNEGRSTTRVDSYIQRGRDITSGIAKEIFGISS